MKTHIYVSTPTPTTIPLPPPPQKKKKKKTVYEHVAGLAVIAEAATVTWGAFQKHLWALKSKSS